jgi:NAD(P)-dependent dehydrogenase (short-subunit alcohol dehydrogenase family)
MSRHQFVIIFTNEPGQGYPLTRAGLDKDIAMAALFLASDEASFVNCHDLVVDGGRTSLFREGA